MVPDAEHPAPAAETTARPWAPKQLRKWGEKKKLPKSRTDSEQEPLSKPRETLTGQDCLKPFTFQVTNWMAKTFKTVRLQSCCPTAARLHITTVRLTVIFCLLVLGI